MTNAELPAWMTETISTWMTETISAEGARTALDAPLPPVTDGGWWRLPIAKAMWEGDARDTGR